MPNPATAGRWSGPNPQAGHRSPVGVPGGLGRGSGSEWMKDAVDVLIAGALLTLALFALLF
jgi:hypothetical protein